jgi:hypothetical protein
MKTFGNLNTQELISVALDEDGNPQLDTLAPNPKPDDWEPPTLIPLVKLPKPDLADGETCDPVIVWFEDRVERGWHVHPVPAEVLAAQVREASIAALRDQWATMPAWVRGPYGASYAAAQTLIEAGDDDAAVALITYAEPPSGYSAEQLEIFTAIRAGLITSIQNL